MHKGQYDNKMHKINDKYLQITDRSIYVANLYADTKKHMKATHVTKQLRLGFPTKQQTTVQSWVPNIFYPNR